MLHPSFDVTLVLADTLHAKDIKLLRLKAVWVVLVTTTKLSKSKVIWRDEFA